MYHLLEQNCGNYKFSTLIPLKIVFEKNYKTHKDNHFTNNHLGTLLKILQ